MTRKKRGNHPRYGFTMVELMAMLIIIGLLAALVVTRVSSHIDKAQITTTKANLKMLHDAVSQYRLLLGRYPSEDTGLLDLVEAPTDVENYPIGGFLETTEVPKDAWNNEFYYQRYPESGKEFVIISFGPDGEEGTEDDLYSTDAN